MRVDAVKSTRSLLLALMALSLFGACIEVTFANFFSLTPRAMSSEGKIAVRCLSSTAAQACTWSGWQSWSQLRQRCGDIACMKPVLQGTGYALKRAGTANASVIAVGVNVSKGMLGDAWLGVEEAPIHCIDATSIPGPLQRLVRGSARATSVERAADPRCAMLDVLPSVEELRGVIADRR